MDLPTHYMFGMAVGFVFFSRPEVALLVGLGALLPDLDREYWFIRAKKYADEQNHRALLHNVFMMLLTYLVSPFLSLGVFLHVLQDSFTTVKDRGVEWFFPITRLVKRGLYDSQGNPEPQDPKANIYFYQEDPPGLVKKADPDLQEEDVKPVPWRRVYGFAQNSHLLDRGFLLGSTAIVLVWLVVPSATNFMTLGSYVVANYYTWLIGYGFAVVLYLAGELDRRGSIPRLGRLNWIKYPLFAVGLILAAYWLDLSQTSVGANLSAIFGTPVSTILGILSVLVASAIAVYWQTRPKKRPAIV